MSYLTEASSLVLRAGMQRAGRRVQLSTDAKLWLLKQGLAATMADEVISVLRKSGENPTAKTFQMFGPAGLKALTDSIEREHKLSDKFSKKISITISVPHQQMEQKIDIGVGETLYAARHRCDVLETHVEWACGGNAACSTCHVVVDAKTFSRLDAAEEEEMDMLDHAWGLTDTSRLGCQLKMGTDCEGAVVTVPQEVNNMF